MWLCTGKDVTKNGDIQQPAPLGPPVQGGENLLATRSYIWSSDVNDRSMAWLERGVVVVSIRAANKRFYGGRNGEQGVGI